jgi:hypothetical protein
MKNLIFLLGLPRSGTTLLQRVLSAHPEVASLAEPWVLLPLVTCFDAQITRSVYGHNVLEKAIADLKIEAGRFQQQHDHHIRSFINEIYTPLRGNKKYFLDKTPRYYLIAEELHRLFPDAKFIYLFRNPIDIYDSVIETFREGRLYGLSFNYIDVTEGLNLLCKSFEQSRDALKVSYEDFCLDGESAVGQICNYLEIENRPEILTQFSQVEFSGKLVDPKHGLLDKVTKPRKAQQPISMIRRRLYAQWLGNISELAWEVSGYQRDNLLSQLERRPVAGIRQQVRELLDFASFARRRRLSRLSQRYLGKKSKYGDFFF